VHTDDNYFAAQHGYRAICAADMSMAKVLTEFSDRTVGNPGVMLQNLLGYTPEDYPDLLTALSESGSSYVDVLASYLHNIRVMSEDAIGDPSLITPALHEAFCQKYMSVMIDTMKSSVSGRPVSIQAPPKPKPPRMPHNDSSARNKKAPLSSLKQLLQGLSGLVMQDQNPRLSKDMLFQLQALLSASHAPMPEVHYKQPVQCRPAEVPVDVAQMACLLLGQQAADRMDYNNQPGLLRQHMGYDNQSAHLMSNAADLMKALRAPVHSSKQYGAPSFSHAAGLECAAHLLPGIPPHMLSSLLPSWGL